MQTILRLVAFGALLIVAFVVSLGVGAAVGPLDAPEPAGHHHSPDVIHGGADR
jgi:hypothetical protein